jgi:hypothetical protein
MNKKILILMIGIFILIPFITAESIGVFKQNQEMQITNYCSTSDCTYANITRIILPNGTINTINEEMTQTGYNFNYSYTPTELGTYKFTSCSNPSGVNVCEEDRFEVVEQEKTGVFAFNFNETTNIIIYLILFTLSILTFIIKRQEISSLIMLILGFYMLVNGVNTIASLLVISLGVIIAFIGGDN